MSGGVLSVLDDLGYVRFIDAMGDDLRVTNAARVSYDKEKVQWDEKDARLLNFLVREDHSSPFRHSVVQYEVYAPLMVARQWWKYRIGSMHIDTFEAWNESSRRYITEEPTFYVPDVHEWRTAPENSKQGSGPPLEPDDGARFTAALIRLTDNCMNLYEEALKSGIAPEQARLFLPAYGMYVRWRWQASLQSVMHFLKQRLEHDAQAEIQEFAKAIFQITKPLFPNSLRLIGESQAL